MALVVFLSLPTLVAAQPQVEGELNRAKAARQRPLGRAERAG